jgi:beta-fructofuranosidase
MKHRKGIAVKNKETTKKIVIYLMIITFAAGTLFAEPVLQDKTLVAWVAPENLAQRGGSVLTIDDRAGHFDGIVFGEVARAKWMAGSDDFRRTARDQTAWPTETVDANTLVQIAVVYCGNEVATYRDGIEYSRHTIQEPQTFGPNSVILIGPRHLGNNSCFAGAVDDARIYGSALTEQQLAALKPNVDSEPKPWAWWTFDDASATERTGRFPFTRLYHGARVEDGSLLLEAEGSALLAGARADLVDSLRKQQKK